MREKQETPVLNEYHVTFIVQALHPPAALDEVYRRLKMGGDADEVKECGTK